MSNMLNAADTKNINILVIDNFYDTPDLIRKTAMELNFIRRDNAPYPGREALFENNDTLYIAGQIQKLIPEQTFLQNERYTHFPQGKFHHAILADNAQRSVGVHCDIPKWSAIVYLSKFADLNGGTYWYQHKATGAMRDTSEFLQHTFKNVDMKSMPAKKQAIYEQSMDMSQWLEIQHIAMVYNRLVVFRSDHFHANPILFGNDLDTGRLTQHFVFYTQ